LSTLLIESAADTAIIAVSHNNKTAYRISHDKGTHSREMFVNVKAVLAECGCTMKDISLIGTGIGPGSFTGIRIAVSSARMLAQVLRIPLAGIHSQKLYASSVDAQEGSIIITAFDAKKGRVFAAAYRKTNESFEEVLRPGDYYPDEVASILSDSIHFITVGDGAERYKGIIAGSNVECREGFSPDPARMIDLVNYEYGQHKELFKDYRTVVPCYARKSDAEVIHEAKTKLCDPSSEG
jgi:tRNA threonylcarbamoyladenosine biosynthesis protein TsaB